MHARNAIICLAIFVLLLMGAVPETIFGQSAFRHVEAVSSCPAGTAFRITLVSPPSSVNMLTMTTGSSSVPLTFMQYMSPLGPVTPSGQVDQSYALSDVVTHNANYTVWMFHVRPGLKWSDGSNVTAQDILTSFGPKFAFNSTYDFAGLEYEVAQEFPVNSSTAEFVLKAPDAQWPQKIKGDYFTPVLPAATINSQGGGTPNFGTDLAVGPFYLSNYSAGQFQAVMLRNPYFQPQPKICELDINFVDSLSETATYLQAGSTDFAQVEYSNAHAVLSNHNIKLYDEKAQAMTDIDYNDSIYPYNMTAFRQALLYSIDENQIVNSAFAGYGVNAYNAQGAVSPVATEYYNSAQQQYSFNTTQALSLLQSIGMKKGSDGHLQYPNGTDITLGLWADTDNSADPAAANMIVADLQSVGFKVNLQTTSSQTIVGDYTSNVGGIKDGMILATVNVLYFGEPYTDILPGWDTYWLPTVASAHWLWPPSADAEYQSNVTAYDATANTTADTHYLFNMETLNAQYLPSIVVAYPDRLFAVNTAQWTNYPSGVFMYYSYNWNITALVNLMPTGATSQATSTSSSTNSSTAVPPPATSSSATPIVTSSSSMSSTTTTSSNNILIIAAVVVVVIVVIAGVAAFAMRRPKKAAPAPS
jgi:ABC-type transport system substrate-binding protein